MTAEMSVKHELLPAEGEAGVLE